MKNTLRIGLLLTTLFLLSTTVVALETVNNAGTPNTKVVQINDDFNLLLKSNRFVPEKGISASLKSQLNKLAATKPQERIHILMQFEHIPTKEEIEDLKREGVELLSYIPNNSWYVSIPAGKANQLATKSLS